MAMKTTCTRKKKQPMKVLQTESQAWEGLGKMKNKQIDDRDWVKGLPDHLIELVIKRLPVVDCLSFSSVCKPWRSTITKYFEASSLVLPLLVKPGQNDSRIRTCLNVLDQNKNSTVDIQLPYKFIGILGSYIWGSYRDWLFLVRYFEVDYQGYIQITLLNPFSGDMVVLPMTYNDYNMIVLSSIPTDPRCICMLVHHHDHKVAFWTPGAREWHTCRFVGCERYGCNHNFVDAIHHKGQFYLLKSPYDIDIIDEKTVLNMLNNSSTDRSTIVSQNLGLKKPCLKFTPNNTRKYLVELSGDIVLVCRIFYDDRYKNKSSGLGTFKLDVCQRAWVKLESLGKDKVIFLGKSCSRSFHVKKDLGDDSLANNIYFSNSSNNFWINQWGNERGARKCLVERNDVDDWGVFNLESSRAFCERGKIWPGTWVSAPIWWCLKLRLRR